MKIVDIKENIRQLPVKERINITRWIITNFDEINKGEDIVETAWRNEVRARINNIKSGKVKMIPSEEMWKDILYDYSKTG